MNALEVNMFSRLIKIILFLSICLSFFIAWLTPAFSIPDESAHYLRSFEVSRGHWINSRGNVGVTIPCNDYLEVAKQNEQVRVAFYQDSAEKMLPNARDCVTSSKNSAGSYSPVPYIAAAAGILFAEQLGYKVETRLKMGRIANALVTSIICIFSILAVKKNRLLIASFVFLPMSMWLRASLSADAMTITVSIAYLAYVLHLIENKYKINKNIIFILSALALLLGSVKPVYGILSLSSIILFERTGTWRMNLKNIGMLAVPGVLSLAIGAMWTIAADPGLIYINNYGGANPVQQWSFLCKDPAIIFHIVANTFKNNLTIFVAQALVPMLPLQWIPQHDQIAISSTLGIFLAFTMLTTPFSLSTWQRITLLGISAICLVLTLLPLYLTFTLVGYGEILGLQGRYFLPISFYMIVAGCIDRPQVIFANMNVRLVVAIIIPNLMVLVLLVKYLG